MNPRKKSKEKSQTKKKPKRIKGGGVKVGAALLRHAEHVKKLDSIQIYKHVEIVPIHDENETDLWRERYAKGKSELDLVDMKKYLVRNSKGTIDKSILTDKPWLLKNLDLGERLRKFIESGKAKIAAGIIRDYPEVVFYDDEEVQLCLIVRLGPEGYDKLMEKHLNPLFPNPLRLQVFRWSFLTKWGVLLNKRVREPT